MARDLEKYLKDVSLIKRVLREQEDRVIATSAHIKLLLSFCGVITASCVVAFSLVAQGADISAVVLLLLAVSLFTLAVFTFKDLFVEAYVTLGLGIVLASVEMPSAVAYQFTGYGAAAVFLTCGLHTRRVMKRRNG